MLVLGIETSGSEGTVALAQDGMLLGERELNQAGRRHAQGLVLEIRELLLGHGFRPQDLQLVAVSRGPGSFTGLRVGMVCAKTMAYSIGCRFIAVDTFAAIAAGVSRDAARLCVIEDAQKEDLFLGEYTRNSQSDWQRTSPIRIVSVAEFLESCDASSVVTGPGLKKLNLHLGTSQALPATQIPSSQPRASVIAEIGKALVTQEANRLPDSETDFWSASPFYLRLSAAEEKYASQSRALEPVKPPSQ